MIRRVVELPRARLYLADALSVLQTAEPIGAQALISDPPYCSGGFTESAKRQAKGQGLRSETLAADDIWFGGDNMTSMGLAWLLRQIAVAFKYHAESSGSTLSFMCDWRMVPLLAPMIESAGLRYQSMPIWDKGAAGLGTGFRSQHECCLHFAIDTPQYHSSSYGNVLRSGRVNPAERQHVTEKPLRIMLPMIEVQSSPGGTVLDPFMGSGSTGVACVRNGRFFVGIEHDPEIFEVAKRRIEEAHGAGVAELRSGALL